MHKTPIELFVIIKLWHLKIVNREFQLLSWKRFHNTSSRAQGYKMMKTTTSIAYHYNNEN